MKTISQSLKTLGFLIFALSICSCESGSLEENEISEEQKEEEKDAYLTVTDFSADKNEIIAPNPSVELGFVKALTNSEEDLVFTLKNQSPEGALSIDSSTGELKIADYTYFDFEFFPTITAEVTISNSSLSKTASVTITLKDKNEENMFIHNNTVYGLDKIREYDGAWNSNKKKLQMDLRLASSSVEFQPISWIGGTGEYLGFSIWAKDFTDDVEEYEGEFIFDETTDDVDEDFFFETGGTYATGASNFTWKKITAGRVHYKRTDFGANPQLIKDFEYDIKFRLVLSDGSVLSGSFLGKGPSSHFSY